MEEEERRGQKEADNGEEIEKMDVETETRSGRRLEGQLDQAGKDKKGVEKMLSLYFDIVWGTISGQVAPYSNKPLTIKFFSILSLIFVTILWRGHNNRTSRPSRLPIVWAHFGKLTENKRKDKCCPKCLAALVCPSPEI